MSQRGVMGVALLAIWLASEGDIQLARAVRGLPEFDPGQLWHSLSYYVGHPPLWLAVSLLAGHFFLWLFVLARLELSVAVPLTACYYVFNAILVQVRLHEQVTPKVWSGTLLITLGVWLVSRSVPSEVKPAAVGAASPDHSHPQTVDADPGV